MDKRLPWTLRKRKGASGLSKPSEPNTNTVVPHQGNAGSGLARQASRDDASPPRRARKRQKQQHAPAGTCFPPEVVRLCAQRLPPNEVSCTLRAVCRSARDTLAPDPRHCTAQLSAPLPPHVAAWSPAALHGAITALHHLSFVRKLCLPALAASSGCTTNLEVAWRLVAPCLCPQLPLRLYTSQLPEGADAGVAAARMGRSDLVVWLAERRCPLVPARAARAAAVHCSLAGLREAWGALLLLDPGLGAEAEACWREVRKVADGEAEAREAGGGGEGGEGGGGGGGGGVPCRDVQEKGAWLCEQHVRHHQLQEQQQQQGQQQQHQEQQQEGHMADDAQQQAPAAADLLPPEWRWPRRMGGRVGGVASHPGPRCSCCAPRRQESPPNPNSTTTYERLYHAAWQGDVERVRGMLLQLGELQQEGQQQQQQGQQQAADGEGQQQGQQQAEGPPPPQQQQQQQQGGGGLLRIELRSVFDRTLRSGRIVAARTMLQAGYRPDEDCYYAAATSGHLHCLRWLLLEARPCPFGRYGGSCLSLLAYWPVATTAEQEREALEVLRLLVAAGCTGGSGILHDAAARRGSLPLLLEALRLVPPSQDFFTGDGGGGGGGDGGGSSSSGGGSGMGLQPCVPASLLPTLAASGCEAALELCVRGLGKSLRFDILGWCCCAWAHAAWRGNMATLQCLRRLGVPWDCDRFSRELKAWAPWGYAPSWRAPLTVPVLRWAVEETGCWELGAGACRQLAGCLEVCLQQAREFAVKGGLQGAAGGHGEGSGVRGEWGPGLWPDWGAYKRAMEAVVEWLMKRAKRLDKEEGLAR